MAVAVLAPSLLLPRIADYARDISAPRVLSRLAKEGSLNLHNEVAGEGHIAVRIALRAEYAQTLAGAATSQPTEKSWNRSTVVVLHVSLDVVNQTANVQHISDCALARHLFAEMCSDPVVCRSIGRIFELTSSFMLPGEIGISDAFADEGKATAEAKILKRSSEAERAVKRQKSGSDEGAAQSAGLWSAKAPEQLSTVEHAGDELVLASSPPWVNAAADAFLEFCAMNLPCDEAKTTNVRLQCFPRTSEREFGIRLATARPDIECHPVKFDTVVNVVLVQSGSTVMFGLSPADKYLVQPIESSDSDRDDAVSRAHWKVREALERVGLPPQPTWTVLDVGAAPGGWSRFFAETVSRVVAVDPARLSDGLLEMYPNIIHIKTRLNKDSSDRVAVHGPYDAWVCDINQGPDVVLDVLCDAIPMLRHGAVVVCTFKLPRRTPTSEAQEKRIQDFSDLFQQRCPELEDFRVLWLLANRHERTLIARKRTVALD